jgi:uncharacterized protein YbaR (Trm112 family)
MRTDLLDLLACPVCEGPVRLQATEGADAEIESGNLHCAACRREYSIRGGIPRLFPETPNAKDATRPDDPAARTAAHFDFELTLGTPNHYRDDIRELREFEFFSRTGIDPALYEQGIADFYPTHLSSGRFDLDGSFLHGKLALDAGCGAGRFLPVAAEHASRVVGLDLGGHIDHAARYCQGLTNIDFVQGSVLRPPFRRGCFDFVYSIGVLHHTEVPGAGAEALGRLVRNGGAMSVWVYPHEYWGNPVRRAVGQRLHSYLSRKEPRAAYRSVRRWLYPLGRLQGILAKRRVTKYLAAPLYVISVPRSPNRDEMMATILDYYASPIIHTHGYEEVREWLKAAGFQRLTKLPVPTSWLGTSKASNAGG